MKKSGRNKRGIYFFMFLFFFLHLPCHLETVFAVTITQEEKDSQALLPGEGRLGFPQMSPLQAALGLAEARLKQGLWAEAAEHANFAASLEKQNPQAHGVLGSIYALTGRKEMAAKELSFLKEKDFYSELIRAIMKAQEGDFKGAREHLKFSLNKEPKHPVAVYYSGSMYLAQNNLGEAEKEFKTVFSFYPNFAPALAGLGQVSLRRKNTAEAVSYYSKALDNDPENLIYRRELLEIYKATGQKEAEQRTLKELMFYTPGVKEIYLKRGRELLFMGEYREAIKISDQALAVYRYFPGGAFIKAAAFVNLGDKEEAKKHLETYIAKGLNFPMTHHDAGMCYLAMGEMSKAEEQFQKVISLAPKSGRSFVPMTVIEQARGNYDRALQGLRIALNQGEPQALIHFLMANIFLAKGDKKEYQKEMLKGKGLIPDVGKKTAEFPGVGKQRIQVASDRNFMVIYFYNTWYGQAIRKSEELIKIDKNDIFAWFFQGMAKAIQRKPEEAIGSFSRVVQLFPEAISIHMQIGTLYSQMNAHDKAIGAYKKALEINPKFASAYLAIGDLHSQMKQQEKAIQAYRQAIELSPDSSSGYQRLAFILARSSKNLDEALDYGLKAVKLSPKDPLSLDSLGWVYVQKKDYKKAVEKLKAASELRKNDPVILYHLGVAYYQDNHLKEAKGALQAALNLSKSFFGADHAAEILEKIGK